MIYLINTFIFITTLLSLIPEIKEEANTVDCGGSETSSSFYPHRHLQRIIDDNEDQILNHKPESNSSECEATFSLKKNTTQETNSPRNMIMKNDLMLSDSELEIHMTIHTGEKPFCCSVCGSRFKQKSSLRSHMKSHTGEKPFTCPLCQKCFGSRGEVRKHMRIHTGEKPFSCSLCHKCFRDRSEVRRHMRIHTGEKPFSCSECSRSFTQRTSLNNHMRVHTGERPFICLVCQKSFTRKHRLHSHMRIHTREQTECHIHRNQTNRD
uniref:C2H2-type domain-containing protein n=1 Tax=Sphaeramia orbicularis TaxID=375764 RepID=A0A672YH31_9TELE